MSRDFFEIECPCCRAKLEVSSDTGTILTHEAPRPEAIPEDLREAVKRLKTEQGARDERFLKQVKAQRDHDKTLEKRFEGLLKKTRGQGPVQPFPRDIDLD